jgi:hypothetical protein
MHNSFYINRSVALVSVVHTVRLNYENAVVVPRVCEVERGEGRIKRRTNLKGLRQQQQQQEQLAHQARQTEEEYSNLHKYRYLLREVTEKRKADHVLNRLNGSCGHSSVLDLPTSIHILTLEFSILNS